MASIDRLNMLIRNYNERFPNATVEQMATYLRRNHPEEYKLFQRVGNVKQNIVNPNFTLGEGSALKYQGKPATNPPARTTTGTNIVPYNNFDPMAVGKNQAELGRIAQEQAAQAERNARAKAAYDWMMKNQGATTGPNVTINPQVQPTPQNPPVRWGDRFQPPAIRDNTDYTKGPKNTTTTKATTPTKTTPKFGGKLGAGGAIIGTLMGLPSLFGLSDENKPLKDKALDAVQGIGGILSPLTLAPHPVAKGVGWLGTAAATGLPVIRGALDGSNQGVAEQIQPQAQAQPVMQQPTQQAVEAAPQVQRATNTPTEYQLPNINITTQPPQATGEFYNRADIMQKELGAMTRGAAQNFNQVQAGPTPEQIQAYANILNLQNQQQDFRQDDARKLQEAQKQDNLINAVNRLSYNLNPPRTVMPNMNVYGVGGQLLYQANNDAARQYQEQQRQQLLQPSNKAEQVQQQIALQEQNRQQQIKNAQEMAKLQDAIALANATGMPINQALGLTGEDILGYNKDVIQRQTDLLGKGIEGGYDIAQKAMEQEGSLAKEGYNQAGQNARTAANIQRDILKAQMDNAAAMERVLQQGQNALSLAEYKARTGTTDGYEDYMRAMISATTNPLMPEEYQMAIWNEAMKRQGILPNNPNGGYYQTDSVVDL